MENAKLEKKEKGSLLIGLRELKNKMDLTFYNLLLNAASMSKEKRERNLASLKLELSEALIRHRERMEKERSEYKEK